MMIYMTDEFQINYTLYVLLWNCTIKGLGLYQRVLYRIDIRKHTRQQTFQLQIWIQKSEWINNQMRPLDYSNEMGEAITSAVVIGAQKIHDNNANTNNLDFIFLPLYLRSHSRAYTAYIAYTSNEALVFNNKVVLYHLIR
jgi:hypothetical protein